MHEHLPEFNLINMNGRVYDPLTAILFSPDPYVQAPGNRLNYNRYGYCLNNPFLYTDPDGEFFWIIPNISWSKNGGLSIGISVVVGIPGVASAQAGVGYSFRGNDVYAYAGATAAFNTVYASYSTQSGFSAGWPAGISPQMGFPISTNFTSVGANYNITHDNWSGNVSAWSVDKNGWTFNPSVSAMFLEEQATNLVRGQGFRSNDEVLKRFVANENYQGALDYFGFKGTYDPSQFKGNEGSTAFADVKTGDIFYSDASFAKNYNYLHFVADHEMRHSMNIKSGMYKDATYIDFPLEEWNTYNYTRQGLYPNHGQDIISQINSHGFQSGMHIMPNGDIIHFSTKGWHFIYKIPRKW